MDKISILTRRISFLLIPMSWKSSWLSSRNNWLLKRMSKDNKRRPQNNWIYAFMKLKKWDIYKNPMNHISSMDTLSNKI
jgi:hypothetical protein